jgi:hypothetical protein
MALKYGSTPPPKYRKERFQRIFFERERARSLLLKFRISGFKN